MAQSHGYTTLPDSPPVSPPNGDLGVDGTSTPLFPAQPNILYIMADQLAAPLLKMHNSKSQIRTPNLDKLAERSVVFDSAYCNSPLCAPSRMAMVTGQLVSKIGAYDNAASIGSDVPTYAHYLRAAGYETVLAGKMHFIGDQLHGYEKRLTADIYPGDFGWAVDWDDPDRRLEWYHNSSSILQAGPCARTNQLDYDEEVLFKSKQYLYDHVRQPADQSRPFAMTVSFTHPHDPYAIEEKYWELYDGVDIDLPTVAAIEESEQDPHSRRLLHVCDLEGRKFSEEQIKRARRAYYGAVSYVDNNVGELLDVLRRCGLDQNTIVLFSGDHGDMLGERGLWYKMSYFESSVRVPLLISHPAQFKPHRVRENVSTMDIMPTLVDLVGSKLEPDLPIDGKSLLPHLYGDSTAHDNVFAEYMGEGTVAPMMMIRRGTWKYVHCPVDPDQLYNLEEDPSELTNLATMAGSDETVQKTLRAFQDEAKTKWDFNGIRKEVLACQRRRRFVWKSLNQGKFTSWDFVPETVESQQNKYIRSMMPLDDLELKARFPTAQNYESVEQKPLSNGNANMQVLLKQQQHLVELTSGLTHFR